MNAMRHEYLWTPTTTFYIGAIIAFVGLRTKLKLQPYHIIPWMMIPVTCDYIKRDYYASSFPKEREELKKRRSIVQ